MFDAARAPGNVSAMPASPLAWRNRSPGKLAIELDEIRAGDVNAAVEAAVNAAASWRSAPLVEKIARMKAACDELLFVYPGAATEVRARFSERR